MSEVIMIVGYPASGKSTAAGGFIKGGYVCLNRDSLPGKNRRTFDLLPMMEEALRAGKSIVLDNTFVSAAKRTPFIEMAKNAGAQIRCLHMNTSIEDAQINALIRMITRYGRVLRTPIECRGMGDSNIFPISVLFKYRKEFEPPTMTEGFDFIDVVPFIRKWPEDYTNRGLILDYDGTLRTVKNGKYFFPTRLEEIEIMPGRTEVLKKYEAEGYVLIGVSNQSGISNTNKYGGQQVSEKEAIACFEHTNRLLGVDIDYNYCPHGTPPNCYCRKPQQALAVQAIMKHKLDPAQCIMVGDRTTDKTFAKRAGFKYFDESEFFA